MGIRVAGAQKAIENPGSVIFLMIILGMCFIVFQYLLWRGLIGYGVCWVINGSDYSFSDDFKFWPFLPLCNIKCEREQCSNNGTGDVTGVIYGDCDCSCDTGYSGDKCQTSVSAPNPPPAPGGPPPAPGGPPPPPGGPPPAPGDHNTASADAESSVPSCTGIRRMTSCNSPESPEVSIQEDNCVNGYVVLEDDSTKGYQCYWVGGTRNSCDAWGGAEGGKTWEERRTKCVVPVTAPPPPAPSSEDDNTHRCVCTAPVGQTGTCREINEEDGSGTLRIRRESFCTNQNSSDDCLQDHPTWANPRNFCKWEPIPQ